MESEWNITIYSSFFIFFEKKINSYVNNLADR